MRKFSLNRLWAMIVKEFIQMKRDKFTFAMMIGVPVMQLILFGFAINTNPKNLPVMIVTADESPYVRTFLQKMKNTEYFNFVKVAKDEKEAKQAIQSFQVQFIVTIPPHFTRDLIRGDRPNLLLESDATDPVAAGNAVAAISVLAQQAFDETLTGVLSNLKATTQPFNLIVHALYNPMENTQYNIVPGLLGIVLTMTMVIITAVAMTRERERGTYENLLATPVRPLEVMLGKIIPFIIVGYIQVTIILLAAYTIFNIPMTGSLYLLFCLCLPFIAANLAIGLTFSTIATNQLQAVQSATFFFLPSILLSGFMFPFRGMPIWAQWVGSILPLTHFVKIVRGILLKGNTFLDVWPELWPILIFMVVAVSVGVHFFRQTLD